MKSLSKKVSLLKTSKIKLRAHSKKKKQMTLDESRAGDRIFLSGVVEGFYGRPWTFPQRKDLFARMKDLGMNTYLYAPKDDIKHRALWREQYDLEEAENLRELIECAKQCGIDFYYALSPGLDITFSSAKELQLLKRKMAQVKDLGCQAFALLFDDIDPQLRGADSEMFSSFGAAQVSVSNDLFKYLKKPKFLFCPTEYCGTRAVPDVENSEYLNTIGVELNPQIDIMWTGPKVISMVITTHTIATLSKVLRRKPVIWDNIHANDYDQRRVFLGPYDGRPVQLYQTLSGMLTNPNCEYEVNFVAVHTLGSWLRCAREAADVEPMIVEAEAGDKASPPPVAEPMEEDASETMLCEGASQRDSDKIDEQNMDKDGIDNKGRVTSEASMKSVSSSSLLESKTEQMQGLYDPQVALRNAVAAWLKEFSKEKSASSKWYAKSGAYSMASESLVVQTQSTSSSTTTTTATSAVCTPSIHVSPTRAAKENSRKQQNAAPQSENKSKDTNSEAATPMDVIEETKEVKKLEASPLTADDLLLLVDMFYLPYSHGRKAKHIVSEFKWLKANAIKEDSSEFQELTEQEQESKVTEWKERSEKFHKLCQSVGDMFVRLVETPNRALLYDLYPYVWDIKEIIQLLDTFVTWLDSRSKKRKQRPFLPEEPEPWLFRGGLCGELQRLLPIVGGHDVFSVRAPDIPTTSVYTIRPYQPEDQKAMYEICLSTCDDGEDGHYLFPNEPDMAGDRFVGPFLRICPEHVFVVEDGYGLCGYALTAPDAKHFYDQYKSHYVHEVAKKYSKPEGKLSSDWTYAEKIADNFHNVKIFLPDDVTSKYGSYVQIDLLARAQSLGLGKRLLACVLSTLKAEGCSGVHCEISATNKDAKEFYSKLGFSDVSLKDEFQEDTIILGRTF